MKTTDRNSLIVFPCPCLLQLSCSKYSSNAHKGQMTKVTLCRNAPTRLLTVMGFNDRTGVVQFNLHLFCSPTLEARMRVVAMILAGGAGGVGGAGAVEQDFERRQRAIQLVAPRGKLEERPDLSGVNTLTTQAAAELLKQEPQAVRTAMRDRYRRDGKVLGLEESAGLDLPELQGHGRLIAAQDHTVEQVVDAVQRGASPVDLQFFNRLPTQERTQQPAQAQASLEGRQLLGIMIIGEERVALISSKPGAAARGRQEGQVDVVHQGEEWEGFKILEISSEAVVLQGKDGKKTLNFPE